MKDSSGYTKAVDWWSLGIICYELMVGHPPFRRKTKSETYDRIISQRPPDYPKMLKPDTKLFIGDLLEFDPARRLGAWQGAWEVKKHAWFSSFNWKAAAKREIKPPFVPSVKQENELPNFSEMEDVFSSLMANLDVEGEGDENGELMPDNPNPGDIII
jgi:serine/threonine protein kinase